MNRTKTISKFLLGVFLFSFLSAPKTALSEPLNSMLDVMTPNTMTQEEMKVESKDNIVVQVKEGTDLNEISSLFPEAALVEVFENTGSLSLDLDSVKEVETLLDEMKASEKVELIYVDETAFLHKVPVDPYYSSFQWNLKKISMEEAWDYSLTQEDVVVAVIDTGVTAYNDMYDILNGADFSTGIMRVDTYPGQYSYDGGNHGTAVASVIAAQHNHIAIAGINPKAKILGVKVFSDGYDQTSMNVVSSGIIWAVNNGADIINLSLGSLNSTSALRDAVQYAHNSGVTVIASTGNDSSPNSIRYPAAYESVIAVGSTDENDEISYFSNEGLQIDLVAPGERIALPDISVEGSYSSFSGTSFSAPTVAGVASLVLDSRPMLTPAVLREILQQSARDLGNVGWDSSSGYGIVDAAKAMELAQYSELIDGNDSKHTAERIYANKTYENYLMPQGDRDYFSFTLLEPYDLSLSLQSSPDLDLKVAVYDEYGNVVGAADAAGDGALKAITGFYEPGTFYIEVQDVYGRASSEPYDIHISAEDSTIPFSMVKSIYDEIIPHDGISFVDAYVEVTDSSYYTWEVLKDGESLGDLSYLTEEGNYELLTEDIMGNSGKSSFVLDRDGILTVKYHAGKDVVLADQKIYYNEKLELPAASRERYSLMGWYTESSYENEFTSGREVVRNLDLYAKWNKEKYTSVEMVSAPIKLNYFVGEELDLSGLELRGIYEDGNSELIDSSMVKSTGFSSEKPLKEQLVTLEVDGYQNTFSISIEEIILDSLKIESAPQKTEYIQGQKLNLDGLRVMGTYNNGDQKEMTVDISHISGFNSSLPMKGQKITVTVDGKTADFMVNILARELVSIVLISPPDKLQYVVGQKISLEGIAVRGQFNDGVEEDIAISEEQISGFDSRIAKEEDQIVVITIQGKTTEFKVKIIDKALESIFIQKLPDKRVYEVGEDLDLKGIEVAGRYNDESISIQVVNLEHISGFKSDVPVTDQEVTITLSGITARFLVDIRPRPSVTVIAGANRYATASAISQASYEKAETAILVQSNNFPDALSAGPLAFALKAPILLTGTTSLSRTTAEELHRLGVKKVIILGGTSAVSQDVEDGLTEKYQVERIEGSNRYNTAVETAKVLKSFGTHEDTVVLASGLSYADALSAGSFASRNALPILLTKGDALNKGTSDYLTSQRVKKVIVVGGSTVVTDALVSELKSKGIAVTRISGTDRFATSVAIGEAYFESSDAVIAANGMEYADALAAAPYAAELNASIILVQKSRIRESVKNYLVGARVNKIIVIGGEQAVGSEVREQLLQLLER